MDFQTRQRIYRREYRNASIAYKRAKTNHAKQQACGVTDGSVQQTRRMYLAAECLRSTAGRYARAQRDLFNGR
jgi:hypothetical protein